MSLRKCNTDCHDISVCCYADCHCAKFHFPVWNYAEYHYAKCDVTKSYYAGSLNVYCYSYCHSTQCHFAEFHFAGFSYLECNMLCAAMTKVLPAGKRMNTTGFNQQRKVLVLPQIFKFWSHLTWLTLKKILKWLSGSNISWWCPSYLMSLMSAQDKSAWLMMKAQ